MREASLRTTQRPHAMGNGRMAGWGGGWGMVGLWQEGGGHCLWRRPDVQKKGWNVDIW